MHDANGQALAYFYCRTNEAEARQAKVLTQDEARRIDINIARLPELLKRYGVAVYLALPDVLPASRPLCSVCDQNHAATQYVAKCQ